MITTVTRWSVSDPDTGMSDTKRAKEVWMKAGARSFRGTQMFTGAFVGQWIFYIDFDDFAHLQKCREAVAQTDTYKEIVASSAKAGNNIVARDILVGMDL